MLSIFRYTAENSVKYGAPRNTDHPELRQPLAFEVWQSIKEQLDPNEKITILTNGPLTNLANIVLSDRDAISVIEVSCLKPSSSMQFQLILIYANFSLVTVSIVMEMFLVCRRFMLLEAIS